MTKARIQPICRANVINLGYFDGDGVYPRSVTNRNSALFIYNNHFCLIGNLKVLVLMKLLQN